MVHASIIVSMYNAGSKVIELLDKLFFPSLLRNASSDKQLILLDDASPLQKETQRLVSKYTPDIGRRFGDFRYIRNPQNLGFAGSYNKGMQIAEGIYLIIANDDVYFPVGSLASLTDILREEPRAGLVGPITNWVTAYQNTRLFPRIRNCSPQELERIERFAAELRRRVGRRTIPVDRLIGFCLAIRRDVIRAVGYLDESFAHGLYEDDDYCLRARQAGFQLLLDLSTFVHHGGPSGGGLSLRQNPWRTVRAAFRNGRRLARKHKIPYRVLIRQSVIGFLQFAFDWKTVTVQLRPYLNAGVEEANA